MEYIKALGLFLRAVFTYCFSKESNHKYYLAGKKLFSLSFRYSENQKHSFVFFYKTFVKSLLLKKTDFNTAFTKYSDGGVYFYDNTPGEVIGEFWQDYEKMHLAHIGYFSKVTVNGAVWKNRLLGYFNVSDKIAQVIFLFLLSIFLTPFAIINKSRASIGLMFFEFVEMVNLLKIVKKNKIDTLFYYSIYEKDSDICAIALQKAGVFVIKVSSSTPLKFWNQIIIADKLVVNTFQQLEETKVFKNTILAKEIEFWGPDETVSVFGRYTKDMYEMNKNAIGYYSSASYVRALEKDLGIYNTSSGESVTMTYLAEYIKTHPGIRLVVFPHPREKNEKYRQQMIEYYKRYFDGLNYTLMLDVRPSAYYFEEVNVGIAFYSSVIFERLYYGFKSMLFMPESSNVHLTELSNGEMCASSKEELFAKIDMFLPMTNTEYFKFVGAVSPILNKLTGIEEKVAQ